jgi:hypothetical protein
MYDSRQYLSKVWPKVLWSGANPSMGVTANPSMPTNNLMYLDGNQVLVFLLGGVGPWDGIFPQANANNGGWNGTRTGFLNSPSNPFNLSGGVANSPSNGAQAKGPFYDFKAKQLDPPYDKNNGFSHYHDPYWDGVTFGQSVFYYFSSRNGNDYNYFSLYQNIVPGVDQFGGYGGMDPFIGSDGKFLRSNAFQIISAGKNKQAGPGSPGNPGVPNAPYAYTAGISPYAPASPGGDDIANFHRGMLGGEE